eukprot:scaffold73117_cov31-Tisochrysis_lutea.AAC.2
MSSRTNATLPRKRRRYSAISVAHHGEPVLSGLKRRRTSTTTACHPEPQSRSDRRPTGASVLLSIQVASSYRPKLRTRRRGTHAVNEPSPIPRQAGCLQADATTGCSLGQHREAHCTDDDDA